MNIQELQTVIHYQLPLKIFVLNNEGYLSIRASQKGFFGGTVGESPESGFHFLIRSNWQKHMALPPGGLIRLILFQVCARFFQNPDQYSAKLSLTLHRDLSRARVQGNCLMAALFGPA